MNNTLTAVSLAVDLLSTVAELTAKFQQVNALLVKAHSEGRDITDAELDAIRKLDDEAKLRLDVAIGKAS